MRKLLTLFLLNSFFCFADYSVIWDEKFSPISGAENLQFLAESGVRVEDDLVNLQERPIPYGAQISIRFLDTFLVWLAVGSFFSTLQSEVFGVGYEARALGKGLANIEHYSFRPPLPFGIGGGYTDLNLSTALSLQQYNQIQSGGVNATGVFAQYMRAHAISDGEVEGRKAWMYLFSKLDMTSDILSTHSPGLPFIGSSNLQQYLSSLNLLFPTRPLSLGKLHALSLVNLVDPYLLYYTYSLVHYIATGDPFEFYYIPILSARYLPSLALTLAPYGPEIHLENWVGHDGRYWMFSVSASELKGDKSWGINFYNPQALKLLLFSLGYELNLFKQPNLKSSLTVHDSLNYSTSPGSYPTLYGGAISGVVMLHLPQSPLSLKAQYGKKTIGFVPGYPYAASDIVRAGVSVQF